MGTSSATHAHCSRWVCVSSYSVDFMLFYRSPMSFDIKYYYVVKRKFLHFNCIAEYFAGVKTLALAAAGAKFAKWE